MKSLTSAARRGGIITVAAVSTLALTACSAGQITQTSSKVVAVDGATAHSENDEVSVLDVTVLLNDQTGDAALKFTATNQDPSLAEHTLESVSVDGQNVQISAGPIAHNCTLVADSQENIDAMPDPEGTSSCTQQIATPIENQDFAYGGQVPVEFVFDTGALQVQAPVSAQHVPSGQVERDYGQGTEEEQH
ncbi:hypothetical protein CGUA_11465 [Corynebacterium guangdongense]|uniref:Uncharacterized protein YggE n=1 Tax=Corynebacterium guangdongense TaxID=1783348 RepID=A0ABU1ZZA6_9CORY|nr:uncharacterized protein YggE [Corynebacterium guangdongense]WJZ18829.1 hypothetical protein CGUA_11465 [Corynebacterium guangdongense]